MQTFVSRAIGCAVLVLVSTGAYANTVYQYVGEDYTFVSPGGQFTLSEYITGSFTVSAPLAGGLILATITPLSYSFSDGPDSLNNTNSTPALFQVFTDSSGNIIAWTIKIEQPVQMSPYTAGIYMASQGSGGTFDEAVEDLPNGALGSEAISTSPGVWVPEPSSYVLLASGLLAAALAKRKRLNSAL